ncbi:hypothetical protein TSOC_005971 [Tetrabaena socialis]|uniref:Guanylate cyclase domain-containing protein n=1 Tax=Tetrabaena socialis TaxID=47790 RepID=A0A2J8A4X5_9CHLO|nr:hypothetical protein TSOC_005971 [Tetrabaena socialis]|eukprot:PNH07555.1 hypothetical protein TSOC_005971 [Tetrabaena socialis]
MAGRQRNASFHLSDLGRIHEQQNPLHHHHQHRQDSQHREDRYHQQLPGERVNSLIGAAVCDLVLEAQVTDNGGRPLPEPSVGVTGRQRNASAHLSDLGRIHERQLPLHHRHQHRQDSQHREDRYHQQLPGEHVNSPTGAATDLVLVAQVTDSSSRPLVVPFVPLHQRSPRSHSQDAVHGADPAGAGWPGRHGGQLGGGAVSGEVALRSGSSLSSSQQVRTVTADATTANAGLGPVAWWLEGSGRAGTDSLAASGSNTVNVIPNDVSPRIWAEWQLARVVAAEHALLENIFPHHIIEHIAVMSSVAPTTAEALYKAGDLPKSSDLSTDLQQLATRLAGAETQATARLAPIRGETFLHLATSHTAITILFCDIQGFTPMCSQMRPMVVLTWMS